MASSTSQAYFVAWLDFSRGQGVEDVPTPTMVSVNGKFASWIFEESSEILNQWFAKFQCSPEYNLMSYHSLRMDQAKSVLASSRKKAKKP